MLSNVIVATARTHAKKAAAGRRKNLYLLPHLIIYLSIMSFIIIRKSTSLPDLLIYQSLYLQYILLLSRKR